MRQRGVETTNDAITGVKAWLTEDGLSDDLLPSVIEAAAKEDPRHDAVTALSLAYRKIVTPKLLPGLSLAYHCPAITNELGNRR